MSKEASAIWAAIEKLEARALKLIERRARKILREHPECTEFVMGMGTAFFSASYDLECEDGDIVRVVDDIWSVTGEWGGRCEEPDYLQPVAELFSEFDDVLKLTGTPMRFTAHGPIKA